MPWLVHRDFKPENVLVGNDGRVRVTDFGLARATPRADRDFGGETTQPSAYAVPHDGAVFQSRAGLTETGIVMGTPAYMAPEQFNGHKADARTDQFGFCVALYQALYGKRPFEGDSMTMLATKVLRGEVRPIPTDSPVPRGLGTIVLRGMSVDPETRFPSMEALLQAIAEATAEASAPAPVQEASPHAGEARRSKWGLFVGGVAAVGLATGAAMWLAQPSPNAVTTAPPAATTPVAAPEPDHPDANAAAARRRAGVRGRARRGRGRGQAERCRQRSARSCSQGRQRPRRPASLLGRSRTTRPISAQEICSGCVA